MNYLQILVGLATNVPGVYRLFSRTHGTDSARYCYSVWLRHLTMAKEHKLTDGPPPVVAELGPGDSLGIGLAALISGTETYYAFDVVQYANVERNLKIFDEIVDLYKRQAPVPDENEFPRVPPRLESYQFPPYLLRDGWLAAAMDPGRLQRIRGSLERMGQGNGDTCISYVVPWDDPALIQSKASSIDMIFSQAVLEHVDNLGLTYATFRHWLRPNGFLSHQIDFTSHRITSEWNGHWTYQDRLWRLMRGKRSWFLNRQPYSVHTSLLKANHFNIVYQQLQEDASGIQKNQLASPFRGMSDADLRTRAAFYQAVNKA